MSGLHTPGPWRVSVPQEEPGGFIGVHILAGAGAARWGVAKVYSDKDATDAEKDAQAANARLIAAAPALLEALKEALEIGDPEGWAKRARLAISQATDSLGGGE